MGTLCLVWQVISKLICSAIYCGLDKINTWNCGEDCLAQQGSTLASGGDDNLNPLCKLPCRSPNSRVRCRHRISHRRRHCRDKHRQHSLHVHQHRLPSHHSRELILSKYGRSKGAPWFLQGIQAHLSTHFNGSAGCHSLRQRRRCHRTFARSGSWHDTRIIPSDQATSLRSRKALRRTTSRQPRLGGCC